MAKIDITRTELVWPGKYNEDETRREVERVSLPFQIIETINQDLMTRGPEQQGLCLALQETTTRPGDAQARVRSGAAEV